MRRGFSSNITPDIPIKDHKVVEWHLDKLPASAFTIMEPLYQIDLYLNDQEEETEEVQPEGDFNDPSFDDLWHLHYLQGNVLQLSFANHRNIKQVAPKEKRERADDNTFQVRISDIEKIIQILKNIPEIRVQASSDEELDDMEWIAARFNELDFITLPQFEYRGDTLKNLQRTWGGIVRHYFENILRDWLYFALSASEPSLEYFQKRYPCMSDYEVLCIFRTVHSSLRKSKNPNIYDLTTKFWEFMALFSMEKNELLNEEEMREIWMSNPITERVIAIAQSWIHRFREFNIDLTDVDLFCVKLEDLIKHFYLPPEYGPDNINEVTIKVNYFFSDGTRSLVEVRADRIGVGEVHDRKSSIPRQGSKTNLEIMLTKLNTAIHLHYTSQQKHGLFTPPQNENGYKFYYYEVRVPELNQVLEELASKSSILDANFLPTYFVHLEGGSKGLAYFIDKIEAQRIFRGYHEILKILIKHKKTFRNMLKYMKRASEGIPSPKLIETVEA
jgi:hypothetical protein